MVRGFASQFCIFGISAICAVHGLIILASAQIAITEVMYDPPQKKDSGYEWLEIINDSQQTLDVTAFRFVEGNTRHYIRESGDGIKDLSPGEVGVIVQDEDVFMNEYPAYSSPLFLSKFSLRQQGGIGEGLDIYNMQTKETVFSFFYTPDPRASGTGASLHVVNGQQIAGPATPGAIAVNPITVMNTEPGQEEVAVEEEVVEEIEQEVLKELQQESPVSVAVKPTFKSQSASADLDSASIQRTSSSDAHSAPTTIVNIPDYSNQMLMWIAIALTVIAAELLVLIAVLHRRRFVETDQQTFF